jgi:SAM-dependent methyltransferase
MSDAPPEPYELPDDRVVEAWRRLIDDYLICEPLEPAFADRLAQGGAERFAELGSAVGPISQLLHVRGVECVALDLQPPVDHFRPMVRADLLSLPFRARSFDAVSAVNCLYFLADPVPAIRAASELLRSGGTFLASAPSRFHDPELADVLDGWGDPSPFDAESAEALVGQVFADLEVRWWEVPAFHLADRSAVVDYLVAFKQPEPEGKADGVRTPVTVTKSGCDVWATAA